MRRQNDTGMTLTPLKKDGGRVQNAAADFVPAALTLTGVYGALCAGWGWEAEPGAWLGLPAGLLLLAVCIWLLPKDSWTAISLAAAALAAAAFCVIFSAQVRSAAAQLLNDILSFLETHSGRIYLRHAQTGNAGVLWALIPAAALLGALLAAAAAYAPYAGLVLTAAVWTACMAGVLDSSVWLIVLSFGGVWMLLTRKMERDAALMQGTLAACLIAAAAALALGLSGAGQSWDSSALHAQAEKTVHRLRYEPTAQAMPEGDFTNAGTLHFTEQEMLKVTLSRPESLYLRGYIGQRYTADGWKPVEPEELAHSAQSFYWLHKTNFYAQSQLSALADCLGFDTQPLELTVTPAGACRENLYAPYELSDSGSVLDPMQNGDGAQRLDGDRTTVLTSDGNLVSHAYELLEALQEKLDAPALADYLEAEGNYRSYVYDTYLRIPEQTAAALTEFLGERPEQITSYEAKYRILNCLDENVTYAQEVPQLPEGHDFTSYFLKELGSGNAVHYATAAVMMLRYFGIPARYAEGYLITPEAVADRTREVTLTLRGTDAHAWAEYYEDGVGWIPFEATPPYRGVMAESDWLWFEQNGNADIQSSEAQNGQLGGNGGSRRPQAQIEQPDTLRQQEEREQSERAQRTARNLRIWLWISLALLLLLLIAATVFLILRRRARLKKRAEAFAQPDPDLAAAALFAHGMRMMWASGMARENIPIPAMCEAAGGWGTDRVQFAQAAEIHALARYSSRAITPEQRELVRQFEQETEQSFIHRLKWYQKLYQKWIRCMY